MPSVPEMETARMPKAVVEAMLRTLDTMEKPPIMRVTQSGTRERVSTEQIAALLAARMAIPVTFPEGLEDGHPTRPAPPMGEGPMREGEGEEEKTCEAPRSLARPATPSSPTSYAKVSSATLRRRVPIAAIPMSSFPEGAYPAPRLEVTPEPAALTRPSAMAEASRPRVGPGAGRWRRLLSGFALLALGGIVLVAIAVPLVYLVLGLLG